MYFWHNCGSVLDKFSISMHNAGMSQAQHNTQHIIFTSRTCFVRSFAKINLTLDVLGKRADGYHDLATIMQSVDLYDTICLTATDDAMVRIVCSRPELCTEANLALRAARAVLERLSLTQGLVIELDKHIPVAAGLGGGSSNAAAVMQALQRWWHLPLSPTDLLSIAASLGSDVPFFLTGGLALCEGRGEYITPLTSRWPASMRWLLLVKPAIEVSTATVFRQLPQADYSNGSSSRAVRDAFIAQRPPLPEELHNSLERGVLALYPAVTEAREAMLRAGASLVRLSGSGPTLFAPFSQLACAIEVQQHMQAQGYEVFLTRAIHPEDGDVTFF
jgi:4-diphosphocytidyl-2-C-methyl-D-erythritol kinase